MTVERIDIAWAAFFGLSPQAFLEPGIRVVAHRQLRITRASGSFAITRRCVSRRRQTL
jgi:hypothetical protein